MKRRIQSFVFAFNGIVYALKTQWNMRMHVLAVFCTVFAGFYLKIERWDWCVVLFCCGLVLVLELLNTSLETLADKLHPEHDERIGIAKDISAGAVLMASIFAVIIGLIVFVPYFF